MAKIRRKLFGLSLLTSSIFSVALAACGNPTPATSVNDDTSKTNDAAISFIPVAQQTDATKFLSAASGSTFSATGNSYQNDGNENTTTRAGLNVTKQAVATALEANLGLNSDGTPKTDNKLADLNAMLPTDKQLSTDDLANIAQVYITPKADNTKTPLTDYVASSKTNAIVTTNLTFKLVAKDGTKFSASNDSTLALSGDLKVKLTDYRRVDETTIKANTGQDLSLSTEDKPASVTNDAIITSLNKFFAITDDAYATPLFPIWNTKDDGTAMWTENNKPVKHSLSDLQITELTKLWTKAKDSETNDKGDFPAARVKRAVQASTFTLATGETGTTVVSESSSKYTIKANLTMDFIRHWSWGSSAYTDRQKSFTLKDITFTVQFKA